MSKYSKSAREEYADELYLKYKSKSDRSVEDTADELYLKYSTKGEKSRKDTADELYEKYKSNHTESTVDTNAVDTSTNGILPLPGRENKNDKAESLNPVKKSKKIVEDVFDEAERKVKQREIEAERLSKAQPAGQKNDEVTEYLKGYTPSATATNTLANLQDFNKETKQFYTASAKSTAKTQFDNMLANGIITQNDYLYLMNETGLIGELQLQINTQTQTDAQTQPQTSTQGQTSTQTQSQWQTKSQAGPIKTSTIPGITSQTSQAQAQQADNAKKTSQITPYANRFKGATELPTQPFEQRVKEMKDKQAIYGTVNQTQIGLSRPEQERKKAYSQNVTNILLSDYEDDVKNNFIYEEQLKYETGVLQQKLKSQYADAYGSNSGNGILRANRYSWAFTDSQKEYRATQQLLKEKNDMLEQVGKINQPYRAIEDPQLVAELEMMFSKNIDPEAAGTVGTMLTQKGYDAKYVYEWYKSQKYEEAIADGKISQLLDAIYVYEMNRYSGGENESDDSYWDKVQKEKSGYKSQYQIAMEAKAKLAQMGYNADDLYAYYAAKLNKEGTDLIVDAVKSVAKDHPVLSAAASIALVPFQKLGGISALAKSIANGTPVDPNDPSMIFANTKSGIDAAAISNSSYIGGMVYKTATTLGSMIANRAIASVAGPLAQPAYAVLSALDAITSSVQEDAQKGYSTEHIAANAFVVAVTTYAASSLGFDKVFSAKSVLEQGLKKAFISAGFSEALEEVSEDIIDKAARDVTAYIFNHETETRAELNRLVALGYSQEEAELKALASTVSQLVETGLIGFITGSAANVVTNSPDYINGIANLVNEYRNNQNVNIDFDENGNYIWDINNDLEEGGWGVVEDAKTPSNSSVGNTNETVDTSNQNAVTEQNTADNNELDNLYDEDVSKEVEQPAEEVDVTVGEDETVYFDFDDDTDFDAVNEEIKTEYDTEAKADLAEKTEPYSSGNAAIDAMVNPNGKLDRKITVDEQAEQDLIDMASKNFKVKVSFVDTLNGKNGLYDPKTGEMLIARDSDKQYVTVFGHEFTHSLEGTDDYYQLFTFLRHNSPYIKNKIADFGNWKAVVDDKIAEYARVGVELTPETAKYEIIADAVADEFFSDYNTMESLATQNRSLFTKLKQWFYTNVLKLNDNTRVYGKHSAARKTYALMLKAEKAATNKTSGGNDVAYSAKKKTDAESILENFNEDDIISNDDRAMPNSASSINWVYKAELFSTKDNILFHQKISEINQNSKAFTKTANGEYMLPINNKIVFTNGDYNLPYISKVIEVMTDSTTDFENIKRMVFIFETGKSRYNEAKRIVEISFGQGSVLQYNPSNRNPVRWTNGRREGSNRREIVRRYQEQRNARRNAESVTSIESVDNIQYSAKKPEIISGLQADYGYSEASANNIYKAAQTLKQNTGSKADVEQLTSAIVTSLENRKSGEIDSDNINRIAMMLAENAQAVNESYVSEYKPIMDYLKGAKISISEADISDLGDAFSYVKKRLFPHVTLAKEGGTPVDTVFQELSARFPNAFDAETITHPADQVKAIAGFIEDYRDNYYFKPYFETDEAYAQLRDNVSELVNDKLIDSSTYLKRLAEMTNKYGELKNGIPQSTDGETRVRRGAASIFGSEAVQKNPERVDRFVRDFVNGKHDYTIMRQGKLAKQYVDNLKASDNVAETIESEYSRLRKKLTNNERLLPIDIVQACALNPLLGDILSDDDYIEYTMLVSEVGTESGQVVSSLKLISQFSGVQRLKAIDNKIEQINADRSKGYPSDAGANAVVDENGQFKITDERLSEGKTPKSNDTKGFIELTVSKRQSKYPPIEIPEKLRNNLKKAKTQDEIEKATDDIHKYIEKQLKPTWFDRFNAWRYFAMLSNPKTAVRNTVGNVAMGATARMKDVIAAAISATPLAKKYKDSSIQTSAVKTTKEARNAATQIIVGSDALFDLYSGQDKYTGRAVDFQQGEAKLGKLEKKIAERNPLLDTIFHKRSIQQSDMAKTGRAIVDKTFGTLSDIQQKMLDDTLFKVLRSKSVLSQSITQAVKNGDIENINDFLAVGLNGNTEHLDNATKIRYQRLFDRIVHQAAKEGDEATFRDDNEFANALNNFAKGNSKRKRALSIVVDALIPFKKTPANIVKRGYEYSPLALGVSLISDRVKLVKGEIDRNTYINNIAKGATGTIIFATGALLSSLGVLNVGDDNEEDKAERKLLGGQNYSINIGEEGTYTIEFLSPAALPLFMGGKVYETVVSLMNGDEIKATEFLLDVMQGVAEPMFAQTMLEGVDGAFEAISRDSAYDDTAGASFMALLNYCAENWVQQFVPSVFGAVARTTDDTVRGYYNESGGDKGLLDSLLVGLQKKDPKGIQRTPAKLDMWGQPIEADSFGERLLENFFSPGYYQENTTDKATLAIHEFADDNDIPYTEILPKEVPKYYDFRGERYNLTAEEYEYYAGVIGKARKEAVEKALIDGENIEVSFRLYDIKPANDSGITFKDVTFTGNLADATNTYDWAPSGESEGYFEYEYSDEDNKKKATSKTAVSDEEFRKFLFDEYMKQVTEEAAFEARKQIAENRK